MRIRQFLLDLRKRFVEEMAAKTGWGRNELIAAFDKVVNEQLAHEIDRSQRVEID